MSAAIPLVGAGISAYGDVQQGNMTSDSLNRQADNLTQQAAESEQKGQYDAMRQQIISGQKIGTSVASFGASGVSASSGSVLDVVQASHMNSELDRMNILHGADIRAINYQNQASMDRYGGENAKLGGYWKALGALTMGAVNVASSGTAAAPPGGGGEGAATAGTAANAGMSEAELSEVGGGAGALGGMA